tara:strand:+ start:3011 stop:4036 length:1026 start_codon:yes stop_codon:yes gene_type:complete
MSSAAGLLIALNELDDEITDEDFEKEAKIRLSPALKRMTSSFFRPSTRRRAGMAATLGGIGGAGFALGRASSSVGKKAVKTRGGTLYLSGRDYTKFMQILKSQGKRAAAKHALSLIRGGRAQFTRSMGKRASEEDFEKEAAQLKLPLPMKNKFRSFLQQIGKVTKKPFLYGAAFAGAGATYGLGAELIDRTTDGILEKKRLASKSKRFRQTVDILKQTSEPEELYEMGLGPDPQRGYYKPSTSKAMLEAAAYDMKKKKKNMRNMFDLMYRQTPYVTTNPVVSSILLRDFVSKDSGQMTHDKLKQLLDIEKNMVNIREMAPYRIRMKKQVDLSRVLIPELAV